MIQVIEQTHEEKIKTLMRCSKKELVQMLIEANRIIDLGRNHEPFVNIGIFDDTNGTPFIYDGSGEINYKQTFNGRVFVF